MRQIFYFQVQTWRIEIDNEYQPRIWPRRDTNIGEDYGRLHSINRRRFRFASVIGTGTVMNVASSIPNYRTPAGGYLLPTRRTL